MRLRLALGKAPYQKWLIRCHLARRGVDLQFCILQTRELATCGGYYAAYLQILYRESVTWKWHTPPPCTQAPGARKLGTGETPAPWRA